MLAVDNLGKRIGDRWIFRHVSFQLERGQVLAILGPNGSGKSSLLKTIAGLWTATEGSRRLSTFGYAGLELTTYPNLTGAEHLALAGELKGVPCRTEELLGRVGLGLAGSKMTSEYSSGMKARLRIALAIQSDPPLLLLDEPTASLDEEGCTMVSSIVTAQRKRGMVLIATNDAAERRWATHELALLA